MLISPRIYPTYYCTFQTLSFALPGWVQFDPAADVMNGTEIVFNKGTKYSAGLWTECSGGLSGCKDNWIEDSVDAALSAGKCAGQSVVSAVPGQKAKPCRKYSSKF